MEISHHWKELLALLNARGVEYVVIGAHAVALHGHPRSTQDLDVLIRPAPDNARRTMSALREFGFGDIGLTEDDFAMAEFFTRIGRVPMQVDFLTTLPGLDWDEIARDAQDAVLEETNVRVIGREQLIKAKRLAGRPQDLYDLKSLGEEPED